jgi:hypothetical protein
MRDILIRDYYGVKKAVGKGPEAGAEDDRNVRYAAAQAFPDIRRGFLDAEYDAFGGFRELRIIIFRH